MDLALIGFGNVGQGFVALLNDKMDQLRDDYGLTPRIVAVVTRSRGTLVDPNGLDLPTLLKIGKAGTFAAYPDGPTLERDWDAARIAAESSATVLIEAGPTDLQTAQPALSIVQTALDSGKHAVLVNKGPVALAYADLQARADAAGVLLRFEGTVMAGTPTVRLGMQDLAGAKISAARGILNGTTNYMLGLMEQGQSYADALADAQAKGYAEPDPSGDVEGWDAAGKLLILSAAVFGRTITMNDIDVTGITGLSGEQIYAAAAENKHYKLIATVTPDSATVEPIGLPVSDPLASVSGATNAITYVTDVLGDVTLIGAGAGPTETGYAILADLLDIHRQVGGQ